MRKSDNKKSFQLYNDYSEHFGLLSDEDAGKLIKTIFAYVNDEPYEELNGVAMMAFSFIRSQLQRDKDKYDARCEANRKNGSLGGRPKKVAEEPETEEIKEEPKKADGSDNNQMVMELDTKTEQQKEPQEPKKKAKTVERTTEFEAFWKVYPRKEGKGEAYKKYLARLKDGWTPQQLESAAAEYKKRCDAERTDKKYIKHPKTFLSDTTPFTDYLKNGMEGAGMYEESDTSQDDTNPFR